jgi:SlyX protein
VTKRWQYGHWRDKQAACTRKKGSTMDNRLETTEVHLTHLMRTVEELSDQVAHQATQIDRLNTRFQMLLDRLSKSDDEGGSDVPLLEQRPPHW